MLKRNLMSLLRIAFMAGWQAGCDHMEPPMGPCSYARNSDDAFQKWWDYRKGAFK